MGFVAFLQFRISDKQITNIKEANEKEIKRMEENFKGEIESQETKITTLNDSFQEKIDALEEIIDTESSDNEHFSIVELLEYGAVQPGEKLYAKNKDSFVAELLANGKVRYEVENNHKKSSINAWLKEVYGWTSVSTYDYAVQASSEKTLNELREDLYFQRRSKDREQNQSLQTIKDLLEHNLVQAGDILFAKNEEEFKAELLENGEVKYQSDNQEVKTSINAWLKAVYGWVSVSTYQYAVHQPTGKTLDELRNA